MTYQYKLVVAAVLFLGLALPTLGQQPEEVSTDKGFLVAKYPGSKNTPPVDCAGDYSFRCADCRSIAVCAGENAPVSTQFCASFNPAAPYCVNGACSSTMPADTGICGAEFRCSSEGYFPHPHDCSKYVFCTNVNGDAYEYSCGEHRVYNSKYKSCANKTKESDCEAFNCANSVNGFVRYNSHLAYYAYCLDNAGRKETILYKCPDEDTSEFDMNTLSCSYKCPGEGRYLNPADCSSFYECYQNGELHQAIRWACPTGFKYNSLTKRCEVGVCP